jgi:LAO/AO transport system kinase
MGLAEDVVKGDEKSAARLISLIEDGKQEGYDQLKLLLPYTGSAHVIGVTGPAGAGKSTLIESLATAFSRQGKKVGVVATDPTSIRGTGAFLGDRLRMKKAEKQNIFIRSMAHRGHPGGVARAATGAVYVLEGLGKDAIFVESTGAGQSEKDLFYLCDTVITVYTPDYGDELQLLKAGLTEIGDIAVVNKSDHQGADDAARELASCFRREACHGDWSVPVLLTRADHGTGAEELVQTIERHWEFLRKEGRRDQRRRDKSYFLTMALFKEWVWKELSSRFESNERFASFMQLVRNREVDPYSAVEKLLATIEIKVMDFSISSLKIHDH